MRYIAQYNLHNSSIFLLNIRTVTVTVLCTLCKLPQALISHRNCLFIVIVIVLHILSCISNYLFLYFTKDLFVMKFIVSIYNVPYILMYNYALYFLKSALVVQKNVFICT